MGSGASAAAEILGSTPRDRDANAEIGGLRKGSVVLQRTDVDLFEYYDVTGVIMPGLQRVTNKKSMDDLMARVLSKKDRSAASIEKEVAALRKMDHPKISKLYEVFEDDTSYFLVMELASLGCLSEALVAGPLPDSAAANIMDQLLRAVIYMHDQKVCHRSLRPDAIMIHDKGENLGLEFCTARLADFRTARYFKTNEMMTSAAGSAEFCSPQLLLDKGYTHYTDVWSCGAVMHALLLGVGPFGCCPGGENVSDYLPGKAEATEFWDCVRSHTMVRKDAWGNLPRPAVKMLRKLLESEEQRRWGLFECRGWRWLADRRPDRGELPFSIQHLESMNAFCSLNKLQKTAVNIIARRLPEHEIEKLRGVFSSIDADDSGVVGIDELAAAIQKLKGKAATDESWRCQQAYQVFGSVSELMNMLDTNGSKELDFTEFVAAVLPKKYYASSEADSMLQAAFMTLDADGSGELGLDELEQVLFEDGRVESEEDKAYLRELLKAADLDGNGSIDYCEFVLMMRTSSDAGITTPAASKANSDAGITTPSASKANSRHSSKQSTSRHGSKQSTLMPLARLPSLRSFISGN